MLDVSVIIPLYNVDKDIVSNVKKIIKDVSKNCSEVILVGTEKELEGFSKPGAKVKVITNTTEDTSYCNQVMLGVEAATSKYFSVVEQDDTVSENWFSNVEKYFDFEGTEIFGYLPLTELIDFDTKDTIGYSNEAFWASSFSDEIGFADIGALQNYFNFNTSGAVFKKSEFVSLGGLKKSMKLVFWYEFLLRALYKEKKIFVIPKVGYTHIVNKEGTMSDFYQKNMSEKEADWWIDLAGKEYYFPQDRNKVYEEE